MSLYLDLFERLLIWHQFVILMSHVQKHASLRVIADHSREEFGI